MLIVFALERSEHSPSSKQWRSPADFMFLLAVEEFELLRSQFATLRLSRGQHRKYAPMVFTEHGVAMLSSVLRSPRAVQVNIEIMRAFLNDSTGGLVQRKVADARLSYVFVGCSIRMWNSLGNLRRRA